MNQSTSSITFVDVRKRFDFRRISIGRWVTKVERDRSATQFYAALIDLMQALNCPEIVISLRGSLSFSYGIGGRVGVAAHYDPSARTFSLAKNAGPGSIAHEWFHALDHYLADKVFSDSVTGMFASTAWLSEATPVPHALNDKLYRCFKAIALSPDGTTVSDLFRASAAMDRKLKVQYYAKPEELCARAFEAFIDDKVRNKFLVGNTRNSEEAKFGLYPKALQREQINSAFEDYFKSLAVALGR
ncbi:MAG: hypothetical protein HRU06_04315 [Oceanospirillaceae bacterium]|nr:hypothetical protein [Oceanospirillaceae bacterium]